ncbi:MAG: carboxyl-terminal processing protease [Pirellulaceae bacterium]
MPTRNLLVITLTAIIAMVCYTKAQRNRYAAGITEAMQIIDAKYVEEVDIRDLYENAMDGLVDGLDQYSSYISPSDYQKFQESIDQKFGGIGIHVELNETTKRLTILGPLLNTPAFEAGLKPGDTILSIDGSDTAGLDLRDAVKLMRGDPGEIVKLVLRRYGETDTRTFEIPRAIIPVESVHGDRRLDDGRWEFKLREDPRICYIRLTTFGEESVRELKNAMVGADRKQPPPEALILDIRDNAGGLLRAAVETCDMFLRSGAIVSTRGRKKNDSYSATTKTVIPMSVPIVVLVNHESASASEIVSACLQDHERAIVIGDRTWGKGTVQNIISLDNGKSALKLTTASYWRPSNKNIHRHKDATNEDDWGVKPNEGFALKLTDEQRRAMQLDRRAREIYFGDNQPPPKPATESPKAPATDSASEGKSSPDDETSTQTPETKAATDDEPNVAVESLQLTLEDLQLKLAIEHLQKRLDNK